MHAVTAAAQSSEIDADTAFKMEERATAMLLVPLSPVWPSSPWTGAMP